ncbi:hypothetical protein DYU11_10590 [Fibrisoma montanum]|uniref:Uncharacterized protein n=1 Tax=Fibrisoma montanum TaxID=2305895 RepID=A0A418MAQ5_9BACT|nr:hypothetical protein [Fibrisoma montanum]RIV23441.1 hypothetical protein DYU11_10590 [Fibrisoma montanum]
MIAAHSHFEKDGHSIPDSQVWKLITVDAFMMNAYVLLKRLTISNEKAYGLDYQNVKTEHVPLVVRPADDIPLVRIRQPLPSPMTNRSAT